MTQRTLRYGPVFRRWLLLAMVFGVPVIFLPGITFDAFNVPKLGLLVASTGCVGTSYLIEWAFGGGGGVRSRTLILPACFITIPLTLSWVMSSYRSWSMLGAHGRYEGLFPYLVVVVAGIFLADTFRKRPLELAWAFVSSGTVVALYALIQALGLDPADIPIDPYVPSTLGHGNFVGGFLAIVLPLAIAIWIGNLPGHRGALICTIFLASGILLSFSQGGLAAAVAGLGLSGGLLAGARFRRAPGIGLAVAAAVALLILGYVLYAFLAPTGPLVEGTVRARAHWWKASMSMAADSPVFGHGPNVYAIESPSYRTPLDAVTHGSILSDAPHSVPMSMLANAGILGLAGYLLTMGWAFSRGKFHSSGGALRAGFAGGVAAYFVQSLVSFDQPALVLGLWVSLAGLVAVTSSPDDKSKTPESRRRILHRIGTLILASLILVATLGWTSRFLVGDAWALAGAKAFERDEVKRGRALFHRAIAFNDNPAYRQALGIRLGQAAVDRGEAGEPLLHEMRDTFSYLDRVPILYGILDEARWLHLWSVFDLESDREAARLLGEAVDRDPYNPEIRIQLAEALLHLDRAREAEAVLQEIIPVLERYSAIRRAYPSLWALLAVAKDNLGDKASANDFLERALREAEAIGVEDSDCHILLARVRVAEERSKRIALALGLFCSRVIDDLLPPDLQAQIRGPERDPLSSREASYLINSKILNIGM